MSQYPPPPPSYGAYDQPPPPGFGYPPNQGPYYPQPGYPQQPTTCPPAPGGYYPGQPATQTIDKTEKSSPKKEKEGLVRAMHVFTVEAGTRKSIPMLHSKKYKLLNNEEETPVSAELDEEKKKSYAEDFKDRKCQSIATEISDVNNDNCTLESSDKKHTTATAELVDEECESKALELVHGKYSPTASEQADEKYLPTAPELNDEKYYENSMEWTSGKKCKPTAPELDVEMYPLSAGELVKRKATPISSTDDLTVRTIGHGKYQLNIDELTGNRGCYPVEQRLVNVTELNDEKYKPSAPELVTGKYQLSAADLVDRKFSSKPNVDYEKYDYEKSYGSMGKPYTYPITEMEGRSKPYPAEDCYTGAQNYDLRKQKQDDDNGWTAQDCAGCCEVTGYCLLCIFHILSAFKN
ncbi:uncharacterized protein LOC129219636 isoform X2 [Uloborus diversus]|uniref:uncharacterized protein LOC129219636 isoform X2 n=1 Tax=Uloborus diversus TaxID=327109 RepID=UPI002409F780|nr:uncharacterized protein LOC129219636 isoform X2 [Uloborus diversus]